MQIIYQHDYHMLRCIAVERRGNLYNTMVIVERIRARIRANNGNKTLGRDMVDQD
jgi:hypothetical protein